jgi:hypothetical protein
VDDHDNPDVTARIRIALIDEVADRAGRDRGSDACGEKTGASICGTRWGNARGRVNGAWNRLARTVPTQTQTPPRGRTRIPCSISSIPPILPAFGGPLEATRNRKMRDDRVALSFARNLPLFKQITGCRHSARS